MRRTSRRRISPRPHQLAAASTRGCINPRLYRTRSGADLATADQPLLLKRDGKLPESTRALSAASSGCS